MEHFYNDGVLTIRLGGRIDSNNAAEAEKEIFDLIGDSKSVVLDAADTDYISSAGLRIILKLKKTIADSKIINASPAVYEIFEITGFSEIIDVEKAMREISVEGCEKIGEGGFGIVYRVNDDKIVKLYKRVGIDIIKKEINYAKQAFIKGIPTAISYDIVKCGEMYGVVFELIKSDTLSNAVMKEPERLDEYMDKYVKLIKTVNSTDVSDFISIRANDVYCDIFKGLKGYITDEEYSRLTDIIRTVPERNTMIHGDLHARNVMLQEGDLLLIDMDEIMRGHPIYEVSDIYFAHNYLGKSGRTERFLGMSKEISDKFIDRFTKAYFAGMNDEDLKTVLEGMNAFAALRGAYAIVLVNTQHPSDEIMQRVAGMIRKEILPNADAIAAAIGLM